VFQIKPVSPPAPECFVPKQFETESEVLSTLIVNGWSEIHHPSGTVWRHDVSGRIVRIVEVDA